ncbi:MAG: hypothetical protein ABFD98_15140 [Syntrophobacteraceae bacterium]|nr:hypothetical protein [Desulfobacteraceae bacterium]
MKPTDLENFVAANSHKILAIIIILFGVVQLILFSFHSLPLCRSETDGIDYMSRATGHYLQLSSFHGPGFSLAIRFIHALGFDLFAAAKVVSILSGGLFLLSTWMILSSFLIPLEVAVALALVALNPAILISSNAIMSDMMAASLLLFLTAALLVPEDPGRIRFCLCGIIGGLCYITRVAYAPLIMLIPFMALANLSKRKAMESTTRISVFSLGFLLPASPWFAFLYQAKGSPFWNENYLNIAFKMYRQEESWNYFPSFDRFTGLLDVFLSNPTLFITSYLQTLKELPWELLELFPKAGYLAAFGILLWFADIDRKKLIFTVLLGLYGTIVSLVWIEDRFLLIFTPLVAGTIAIAVFSVPVGIKSSNLPGPLAGILEKLPLRASAAVIVLIIACVVGIDRTRAHYADQPVEYKKVADWFHSSGIARKSATLMTAKPHIPYFCGMKFLDYNDFDIQNADIEDLPKIIQDSKADFFVYDERYASVEYPKLNTLLETNPFPELLLKVYEVGHPKRVIVYRCVN